MNVNADQYKWELVLYFVDAMEQWTASMLLNVPNLRMSRDQRRRAEAVRRWSWRQSG